MATVWPTLETGDMIVVWDPARSSPMVAVVEIRTTLAPGRSVKDSATGIVSICFLYFTWPDEQRFRAFSKM